MDPLSHFILSLAVGMLAYEIVKPAQCRSIVVLLAFFAGLIDLDHILVFLDITRILVLHNVFTLTIFPGVTAKLLGRKPGLILALMLFGSLVMDMTVGLYGIPMFYPLTVKDFLIPASLEFFLFGDMRNPVVSTTGIGLFASFAPLILLFFFRSSVMPFLEDEKQVPKD